eukprot:CAMPEP_0113318820 /NCGR_PEP_ID=MMETSP0010_2-20120614/13249_1 /TAXON_ID=216773 ORGANISM="Corethron hystrix, Strain 308" /NCGR_SAMPLE_ID=MMETSP0010_2 /ASSEMBLY_ACC=CAM_ASM_000155 /LENGTH=59 /DNA_ID=CAMNT_0000176225 /DNA_START=55 /DNA_END=234 /DNA_ORIENTATION=- /assembly_acc=CAM_ASM_000155
MSIAPIARPSWFPLMQQRNTATPQHRKNAQRSPSATDSSPPWMMPFRFSMVSHNMGSSS